MKGRCLPPWGLAGIGGQFPSYSTKGAQGTLAGHGPALGSNPGDGSVTLSSTSESRVGQAGLSPFPSVPVSQPCWSPERVKRPGAGILGPDPLWEALLASATRDSSKEALGALLTEWVVYLY